VPRSTSDPCLAIVRTVASRLQFLRSMANRLYVGNLPFSFNKQDLEQLFSSFGAIRYAEIISDRMTGQSRGFGFVELETAEQAQAAIQSMHGRDIQGRGLTVNEAREKSARPPGGGGGGGGYAPRAPREGGGGGYAGGGGGGGYSGGRGGGGGHSGGGGRGGYSGGGGGGGGPGGKRRRPDQDDGGGRGGRGGRGGGGEDEGGW
jgi:hypothetical protein